MADITYEMRRNISDLVVADRWKAAIKTAQCMFDESFVAHTLGW